MPIREATIEDIGEIQRIRHAVKENVLSDPSLVTDEHCRDYITRRGKGWVYEAGNQIVGFAIIDLQDDNVWALFLHPHFERRGIGRQLHDIMLRWYFNIKQEGTLWLSTSPDTRAPGFYITAGWAQVGKHGTNEIKFEMSAANWRRLVAL